MNQLFSKVTKVVLSVLFAAFAGSAVAADYTWTGGAENNVLTDGGNWSPKLPTSSWNDVGIIDGLPSGTVLSMGEDYTAPKLLITNTPSLQLDLAGHKLTFGSNANLAWSLSDCELTVTDSVGGGTNVFSNGTAASRLGVNSKLIYDGVSYTRVPAPKFPEDRSSELVFKNGTTAVFGQEDNGRPKDNSRILVDNAKLSWLNNFVRNETVAGYGWEIVAQNNATVSYGAVWSFGSTDPTAPLRLVATSGSSMAFSFRSWNKGHSVIIACTNATMTGLSSSGYPSECRFECVDGSMSGSLGFDQGSVALFSGTCAKLPSLSFAATAADNDVLFTNVTCASFPINSLETLGRGTNNVIRIADSELSNSANNMPINLFTSCGSSPSENSVVEFSGRKAALVSHGQSNNRSINIGQNTTAVAAEDRPRLRFRIPEGGFDDTPIRAEVKNSISWEFNPIIEVVPDGVRYGDEPTYHPLIGFGEGGAGAGWTGARPPSTASNLDNLNEISADYLPHGASLVVMDGTRKSVGVRLPVRIILSAEYASELGTVSAKLSLNREPDAEIHMVYGWENGGEDVDGWEYDEVVESLEIGPISGFGTSFLHLRFYTFNGDGTVSWSPAFEASDDPKLSEPTVDAGGNYVKVSGVLEDAGIFSTTADITLAMAKADEEFGEPVTVKTGVRAGESFDRAVSGLDSSTAYKFRLTATNEHGISTTVEGAFTTTGGSGTTPGVMTVTAGGYTGGTELEGFPLLVRLSEEKLAALGVKGWPAEAESVAFYGADGNELPCEVDTWDPQGEMLFWVKVPSLVGTTTRITLKWGKDVERRLPATDVWTDYALVHHLDDAPVTTEFDSTGNGFKAQPSDAAADCALAEGVVGQSYYKNGGFLQVDDYSSLALGGVFTASGWFYLDQRTAYESFFAKKQDWNVGDGWSSNMQNNDTQLFYTGSGNKTASDIYLSTGVKNRWVHLTYVYDGTTLRFYENGGTATVATKTINAAKDNTFALKVASGDKGRADEIRIRRGAVSVDWVLADYATQHDADFCSFALVTNPQWTDYGEDPVVDWNGPLSVDPTATISLPYDAPWGGDAAALVDVHAVWGFAEDALDHDVIVAAGTLGAGVGLLEDAKPGETYFVKLYAQSGEKTSERTTVRSVRIPSASAVGDSQSGSTRNSYTVSGVVVPGLGLTRVWLRYSFNSDALDQSVFVCEKQIGDDPSFAYEFEPTQSGDALHWQVVVSNDYASATWGDFAWGAKSETAAQILTDTAEVDWTWQTADAGDWQEAGNWSAKDKTGFPNTAGARALFTTATDGATATLQDDVTLKLLKTTGAKVTVDANGRQLTTAGITLALGPNDETPELTFENAVFGANVKPEFPATEGTGGQAKLIYRNSTATLAVGDWAQPAHSALIADGGSLNVSGNYSRGEAGANKPDRLLAALNGARVTLGGFAHLGSDDPEQPHVLVAENGAWLSAGGGLNRTFLHANILVAVTNATLNMGSGGNRNAMGFADDSHFDLNGATLDCYWNLGHRSSAYVTGDCAFAGFGPQLMSNYSWNNTEDKARNGVFSSVNSEILVENARVTGANRLSYVYGTNSTIHIRDSVVVMDGQLNFKPNFGYGSRFVVDNSLVTNKAHWLDFDVQTNVLGSAIVLCGEAPRYVVTGSGSGVSCELGTDAEQTNPAEIRFVLPREGYVEAPIQFRAGKNGRIRAHLPIRIDATGYRKLRRYTMPLISMDQGWGVKATAEDITANLPAGALPKGAKLVWVGKDLCLEMPSMGGLSVIVR